MPEYPEPSLDRSCDYASHLADRRKHEAFWEEHELCSRLRTDRRFGQIMNVEIVTDRVKDFSGGKR
jgi:hypothetical protein